MKTPHRLLLVDDEATNLDVVQMILGEEYDIGYMNSAEGILNRVSDFQPSAILMDIMMPQIDGMEAVYTIRRDPSNWSLPVIMMTAVTDVNSLARAFELGCNDYIRKPIKPEELRARLRHHIQLRDRILGLNQSVTHAQESVEALRTGMRELRGASFQSNFFSKPLRDVTARLNHELNTPLHGVLGSLTVVRDSIAENNHSAADEFLGYAQTSALRIESTIRKLLLFLELNINQVSTPSWPKDEGATCTMNSRALISQIEHFSQHIDLGERLLCDFESIEFRVDVRDIVLILTELVDNAVKFGKDGGIVRITRILSPHTEIVRIKNESEMFFPEEVLREIKAFCQPNRANQEQQGMGLGLYLADEMIKRYNGELQLSNTDSGTQADIILPRHP